MSHPQHNFTGTVYLASDHGGFELKEFIRAKLEESNYKVVDDGALELDKIDDYPIMIRPAAEQAAQDPHSRAVLFGKSGQGEAIVANRVRGVRAAVYTGGNLEIVKLAREHNDANALSIGAHFVQPDEAWDAVQLFLKVPFNGEERHVRRIAEIDE